MENDNKSEVTAKKAAAKPKTFTKEQLIKSQAYKNKRDLLNALLYDDKQYTRAQVNKLIDDYFKKEVK